MNMWQKQPESGQRAAGFLKGVQVPVGPFAFAVALLLLSGLVQVRLLQQAKPAGELERATARLDDLPSHVGEWQAEEKEADRDAVNKAGLSGCVLRAYVQGQRGQRLTACVMCGPPGPTSVHTPEWCYGAAGYKMTAPPVRVRIAPADGSPQAELWMAHFRKARAVHAPPLRIYWCWSATGSWQAPDYPRFAFSRQPALYKFYLIQEMNTSPEAQDRDIDVKFLQLFLPRMSKALFPAAS